MIDTYILLNHKSDIRKETIQPSMAQLLLSFSKVQHCWVWAFSLLSGNFSEAIGSGNPREAELS